MVYNLREQDMLLKQRSDGTGFLTRLNKDKTVPKAFQDWGEGYYKNHTSLPIKVIEEIPRAGWKIVGWRGGKSQTWVKVKHPLNFILEIRMDNFMNDVLQHVTDGQIVKGKWKWTKNEIELAK